MNLKDFSLLKEDMENYTIGHPKGKSIRVPKRGLSDQAQKLISKLKREQHFVDGGMASESVNDSPEQIAADAEAGAGSAQAMPEVTQQDEMSANPPEEAVADRQAAQMPVADTMPEAQANPLLPPMLGEAAINAQEGALKTGAEAEGRAAREESSILNHATNMNSLRQMTSEQRMDEFRAKDEALSKAVQNSEIDPNRVYHNMSTGSKIASGIGMLLSGLGSGLTRQPNMAMAMMDNAINRDIDAQRADQSKKMNLWKMNREALHNEEHANLATQNQMITLAQERMRAAGLQAVGPQAQARIAGAVAEAEQKKNMNRWMMAQSSGDVHPGTEQSYSNNLRVMQMVNPNLHKQMESKYVPGVGVARVPVSPQDREALTGFDSLNKQIDKAIDFQKNKAGALGTFPGSAANAEAQSIANSIVLESGKLHGINRLTDNELHIFKDNTSDPGSFMTSRSLAKLGELKNNLNMHKQALSTHLGITPFYQAAPDQQAVAWAQANRGDPRAMQILQLNGVK